MGMNPRMVCKLSSVHPCGTGLFLMAYFGLLRLSTILRIHQASYIDMHHGIATVHPSEARVLFVKPGRNFPTYFKPFFKWFNTNHFTSLYLTFFLLSFFTHNHNFNL